MKVAIDWEALHQEFQGGITRSFMETVPRVAALDPAIAWTFLAPFTQRVALPDIPQRRVVPQIPTQAVDWRKWRYAARAINAIPARAALSPDTIWHSTYYTFPPARVGAVVTSIFDMIYEALYDKPQGLHTRAARESDLLIFLTEYTRREFCGWFDVDEGRTRVIPLAASPVFQPFTVAPPSRPFFLYVGQRAAEHKNFTRLLEGFSLWRQRGGDAELLVVGSPWTDQERATMERLSVSDAVRWHPRATDAELCRLYNQATALVYPSLYEGFGIPLLEAIACACQIVASRIPSSVEVAVGYPFYFEPESVEGMAAALDAAVTNPRSAEVRAAARQIASQFSWDRAAAGTLVAYQLV